MPDPITPQLPDPQASVDAALGSLGAPTPTTTPTTTTAPVIETPKVEVPPATVPMGDDTPLAFAAPTLNAMPTTPTSTLEPTPAPAMSTAPVAPTVLEAPKLEPMPSVGSSYLPPVPPAPISSPPVEDKPKKKSKIMLVVFGIFALLGVLGVGGYFAYQQYVTQNTIAIVDYGDEASCENNCDGGHKLVWATRNGVTGCYWSTKLCDNGGGGGGTTRGPLKSNGPNQECYYDNNNNGSMDSADEGFGFYCGGEIDKCVSTADLNAAGGGCNKYGEVVLGIPTVYGATCQAGSTTDTQKWVKYCNCGGTDYVFDKMGECDHVGGGGVADGLCAVAAKSGCASAGTGGTPGSENTWVCDANGCRVTNSAPGTAGCFVQKYTCDGMQSNNSCTDNPDGAVSQSKTFSTGNSFCGKVQQIDVACNGVYKESRTKVFPPCDNGEENPVTHKACNVTTKVCETVTGPGADTCATDANCVTTAPVLACTGLTQTPATVPVIGDKVTFTCAGSITPVNTAALTYKFRYSLDGGADQILANKTNTTAELTINACGTYSVQCKVCATIAGVLKCDPTWTGAVQ